jgi:hypothetical protein
MRSPGRARGFRDKMTEKNGTRLFGNSGTIKRFQEKSGECGSC